MVAVVAVVLVPSELSENTLTVYGSVFTAVIKKRGEKRIRYNRTVVNGREYVRVSTCTKKLPKQTKISLTCCCVWQS